MAVRDSSVEYLVKEERPRWVKLVRANSTEYERKVLKARKIVDPCTVVDILRNRLREEVVEVVWVVALTKAHKPQFVAEVARGTIDGAALAPGDVLRMLMCTDAVAFVLVHNHPSGDATPSKEDVEMTKRLQIAANLVGLKMVDHVVATASGGYTSMYSMDMMMSREKLELVVKEAIGGK